MKQVGCELCDNYKSFLKSTKKRVLLSNSEELF